jgi:hypothetical protein
MKTMQQFTVLPLAIFFLSAGVVRSQAPVSESGVTTALQALEATNKATLDKQQKTLDALDQLDQAAQELKTFAKRS